MGDVGYAELAPTCPYCQKKAELDTSNSRAFGSGHPRPLWVCEDCDAYVGCVKGSLLPLGTPGNATTRALRIKAHAVFDVLWRVRAERYPQYGDTREARSLGYAWLAKKLGLNPVTCHIGVMSDADLQRVIDLCVPYAERLLATESTRPSQE